MRKYDYGIPEQGFSLEHYNFYDTLIKKHEVIYFPFDEIMMNVGEDKMNEQMIETACKEKPDLCFFVRTNTIYPATIQEITKKFTTVNWFIDDQHQFESITRHWAPLFTWSITGDPRSVPKYRELGCKVIKSQLGFNHYYYKPQDLEKIYDVTFVGIIKGHSNREWVVKKIKDAGINIKCWGINLEVGRVSQEEMIKIFSQSKINLNPIMCSRGPRTQIKARNFEVPGCRGFLLSEYADGLEEYFEIGKEIACYTDNFIEKIQYYLEHDKEREAIAEAGYKRAIKDHTYEQRFNTIFNEMFNKK